MEAVELTRPLATSIYLLDVPATFLFPVELLFLKLSFPKFSQSHYPSQLFNMRRAGRCKDYDGLYQKAVQDGGLCPNKTDVDSLFDYRPPSGRSTRLYEDVLLPWKA